jgi:hypothetical protein
VAEVQAIVADSEEAVEVGHQAEDSVQGVAVA